MVNDVILDRLELPKKGRFLLKYLCIPNFCSTFAASKVLSNQNIETMTATLTFNPRNRLAMSTMEYIQSLGVFTITTEHPKIARKRSKTSPNVDQQLWTDLKGALREVKSHHEGKQQMQDAYELLNEL